MTRSDEFGRLPPAIAGLLEEGQRSASAGHREIARRRFESALYLLRAENASLAATLVRRVARTYIDDAQFEAAMDCAAAALAVAEARDDRAEIAHALNLIAHVHLQRGEADDAEPLYERALTMAREAGDMRLQAMIEQNLGIINNTRGDLEHALAHYSASLKSCRERDLDDLAALVLNNMGMAFADLARWDHSELAFTEALLKCDAINDATNKLIVQVNFAEMWIGKGELDRADGLCVEVIAQATESKHQRALDEANRFRGTIARRRGDLAAADRLLSGAFSGAMQRQDLLLAAETAREQAELYEATDKNRETLQALTLSHKLFTKLRAQRDLSDLRRRVDRLETKFIDVVRRWAQTIELKDPYTLGHCERVAEYACMLAREVGLDELTMFWFRMGALLHDVGKIVVPSSILNKNGPLTPEERLVMERHAPAGSDLLRDIDFPWDVLPMVRGHHERWDGSGYPDRLAANDIAQPARILCVADVYDALTTDRPYRKAFAQDAALQIMAGDTGRIFDPQLFPVFQDLIRSRPPELVSQTSLALAM